MERGPRFAQAQNEALGRIEGELKQKLLREGEFV